MLSEIGPTGWFGADLADIHRGASVAVFGCGPVGMFAVAAARKMGAGRIFAIDHVTDRLAGLDVGHRRRGKAGTVSIIGVYPPSVETFPIGKAMNKNLSLRMGNCNHRKYLPMLLDMVRSGALGPLSLLTKTNRLTSAIDAYRHFDHRDDGWLEVALTV